jgi:zinc D-Ala-D-Ala carboxypeptidase
MKLSPHFKLREFLISQTATRLDIDMTPSGEILENLSILANKFLEPIRVAVESPIIITSGYRPLELNKAIGGSITSSHVTGEAVDFGVVGLKPHAVCRIIRDLNLNYDQLIHEFGNWTHLGIGFLRRKQELTAYRKEGKTIYIPGIHRIKDLT